jgi:hypothetical protein
MTKAIPSDRLNRRIQLSSISDTRWASIKKHIPKSEALTAEADAGLRREIMECCSWWLTERARLEEGQRSAAAMRSPGKRQPAPLERLAKGLRMAADAWKNIPDFHDDRLSELRRFDDLEAMAQDAERRLTNFLKLGKPRTIESPWNEFVRKVADCWRREGIKPAVTGRVYDKVSAEPSSFQRFMAALNDNLLGDQGKGRERSERTRAAFDAGIAKALRGGKTGKAQK